MLKASMSTGRYRLLHITYTFVVANIGVANIVPVLNAITSIGHSVSVEGLSFEEHRQAEQNIWTRRQNFGHIFPSILHADLRLSQAGELRTANRSQR